LKVFGFARNAVAMQDWSQNFRRLKWSNDSRAPLGKRFLSNRAAQLSQ
jgi:hypothetical protein